METSLLRKWIRFFIVCVSVLFAFFLIRYTLVYLFPFFISAFVANITFPIVQKIEVKWNLSRTISTVFVIFSFIFIHITVLIISTTLLLNELIVLLDTLPLHFQRMKIYLLALYDEQLLPRYESIRDYVTFLPNIASWNVTEYIDFIVHKMNVSSSQIVAILMKSASFAFQSVAQFVTIIVVICLATFFIVKDYETFIYYMRLFLPERFLNTCKDIREHGLQTVMQFLKAQIVIAFLSSCIVFIGLLLFRIEHPFTIATIIFLIDLIPYIGVGLLFIPWLIYSFMMKQFYVAIQLCIIYGVVIFVRQLLEPRIIAKQIGIHPLVALFILFASFQYFGFIGIVLTPLLLIVFSTLYKAQLFHYVWHYIKDGTLVR